MTLNSGSPETGHLTQIFHALGRLEAGQQLNRKAGEQRLADMKGHISNRIADLRTELHTRIDNQDARLSKIETTRFLMLDRIKDIPWRHFGMIAAGAYLAIHGNLSPAEVKELLLKFIGL